MQNFFLIRYDNLKGDQVVSEPIDSVLRLQETTNELIGQTYQITVQQFKANKLVKEITYRVDGNTMTWEKVNAQ